MNQFHLIFKNERNFLLLSVAYTVFLLVMPILFSFASANWIISEQGPIERLSILAWLVVSAQFVFSGFRPQVKWPMALLFAAFAAREADLHKAFTTTGMMKITYYTRSAAPMSEKIIAGSVALVFIGLLLYGAWLFLRFEIFRSGWRSHAGRWLILAGSLFFICKFLDRLPNVLLVEHGIALPPMVDLYCSVFEEGWELLTPVILAWVAWTQKEPLAALE